MINIDDIKHLHMEFSTLCNSRCPLCLRNSNGYPFNNGYKETNLSLSLIEKAFSPEFIRQLNHGIFVNGNFGDFVMNTESLDIFSYFRSHHSNINIKISTNGSARNYDFWTDLAKLVTSVEFCLDGLEDTHSLYRIDTDYYKILSNANAFMQAGGKAIWKMIKFDHNQHQIESCRELSKKLGFNSFEIIDHGRDTGPVYDRKGQFLYNIGKPKRTLEIQSSAQSLMKFRKKFKTFNLSKTYDTSAEPSCLAKKKNSIYVSAEGKVYPCCWLGHSPETYDYDLMGWTNKQIRPLIEKNDLNLYDLETCLSWFSKVEESWQKDSYEEGRVMRCDISCGTCTNK